jgi:hypothetical protein
MGNALTSETWTELCNPQRNVLAHRQDTGSMNKISGYEAINSNRVESKSVSEYCCGEVCTPRSSATTMIKTDRKPIPVSASVHTGGPGETRQDGASNISDDIKALREAHRASNPKNTRTRRSYAPPHLQQYGAASACIDSPRNTAFSHEFAHDTTSLNPR